MDRTYLGRLQGSYKLKAIISLFYCVLSINLGIQNENFPTYYIPRRLGTLVWPDIFFCKHLSLVVNKQDQRTMKMVIKIFLAFPSFWIWRSKTVQSWPSKLFFYVKNHPDPFDFFFVEDKKGEQILLITYVDRFDF